MEESRRVSFSIRISNFYHATESQFHQSVSEDYSYVCMLYIFKFTSQPKAELRELQ